MKKIVLALALITPPLFASGSHTAGKTKVPYKTHYGAQINGTKSVSLNSALKQGNVSNILVKAEVAQVCEKKGCWMGIKEGNQAVRITFKNYGFFVSPKLVGKTVLVEGNLEKKSISVAMQRHYLEDAGASQQEIAKITKPKEKFTMVASGVQIVN